MTQRASILFKIGWISLAIIGVAILVFGLIATMVPTSSDPPYLRAIGVASVGMGQRSVRLASRTVQSRGCGVSRQQDRSEHRSAEQALLPLPDAHSIPTRQGNQIKC